MVGHAPVWSQRRVSGDTPRWNVASPAAARDQLTADAQRAGPNGYLLTVGLAPEEAGRDLMASDLRAGAS
jgi:hypothetical protein